jgi:aminoglycoside phosphotransferase (APT) family kinase protein
MDLPLPPGRAALPPPFDEPAARIALRDAVAVTCGNPAPDGWQLLRIGSNAVFRRQDLIARVAPAGTAVAGVRRSLDVARWLEKAGFPAVRAVADERLAVAQPVIAGEHLVTFWHSVGEVTRLGTTGDLGRLLRRFHALDLPPDLARAVAPLDPVARITRQLDAGAATPVDLAFLRNRLVDVAGRFAGVGPLLPTGHLHGDATVANVVLGDSDEPTLIDLDLLRTGPREWDLLRTAVYARRLGWHTDAEYAQFCAAYGVDVTTAPGFEVLADLVELLQVAWLADAATRRPQASAELAARVESLRTGGSRRGWRAV